MEQAYNVNIRDNLNAFPAFYGIADTSIGIGQVRMSTAELLEDQGYVTKSTEYKVGWNIPGVGFVHCTEKMTRERRLENDQQNVIYVAAYLKYFQDLWVDDYPTIASDPIILGTLYNRGHQRTSPHPDPGPNWFGICVGENYDYMEELLVY